MEKLETSSKRQVSMQDATKLGAAGAAVGAAVSEFTGKDKTIGAIIGSGFTLLVVGLVLALDSK